RLPPPSTLFPYTTLFRSRDHRELPRAGAVDVGEPRPDRDRLPRGTADRAEAVAGDAQPLPAAFRGRRRDRAGDLGPGGPGRRGRDRKSTRLNSSHVAISY